MELANKVGASEIINRIVDDLKDENEQYRKMVMETIEKVTFTILFLTTLNVRKLVPTIWFRVKSLIEFHEQFRGKKRTETSDRTENFAPKLHEIFRRAFFQLKTRSNVPSKITLYVSCAHTSYKVTVLQTTIYDVLYIVIVLVLVCFLDDFEKKNFNGFYFQTMGNLGSSDVDSRLEEQLIDGILYAFQEQTQEVITFLFVCLVLFFHSKSDYCTNSP